MEIAIIDSGIDLEKLYNSERHGYNSHWVSIEKIKENTFENFDVIIIPSGSDFNLLLSVKDKLENFIDDGGWILTFDGISKGLFDGIEWIHTKTEYKSQEFSVCNSEYSHLLKNVLIEELVCKDSVKGWWSEGELVGEKQIPLIVDSKKRVILSLIRSSKSQGGIIATAAARLPLFSTDPLKAANILFMNMLVFCKEKTLYKNKKRKSSKHIYIHSGNWAHRSFLTTELFNKHFYGFHWSNINAYTLKNATSIWVPWESNTKALRGIWDELAIANKNGATLIIEDLRNDWVPNVMWEQRAVDSNWWREKRALDITISSKISDIFPGTNHKSFAWHYHGVFKSPKVSEALITNAKGENILSIVRPNAKIHGSIFYSTLDATFEYGVGKIKETSDYINAIISYTEKASFET